MKKPPSERSDGGFGFSDNRRLVATHTNQAQQEAEQVDEVEIERQSTERGGDAHAGRFTAHFIIHTLKLLRVVGDQAGEDQHARNRDDEFHHRAFEDLS